MCTRTVFFLLAALAAMLGACSKEEKKTVPEMPAQQRNTSEKIRSVSAADTTLANQCFAKAMHFEKAVQYDSAMFYYKKASVLLEAAENWEKLFRCYKKLGDGEGDLKGAFDTALAYFNKALEIGQKKLQEPPAEMVNTYNQIGAVYFSKGQYEQALIFQQQALSLGLAKLGEKHPEVARSYSNVGKIYSSKGDYDQALSFYNKALSIRLTTLGEHHSDVASSYRNIGGIYFWKGDFDQAVFFFTRKPYPFNLRIWGRDIRKPQRFTIISATFI